MKYQFIFIVILLFFSACTERIDLSLNPSGERRLVVDAWLTDETKPHEVKLTLTGDYYENKPAEPAAGAVVRISDGSQTFNLTELSPGRYFTESNVKGEAGKTYTLTIEWEGETYTASSLLRPVTPIDSVQVRVSEFQDDSDSLTDFGLFLYALEPPSKDDSYYWKAFPMEAPNDLTRTFWQVAEDDFVNGNDINGAEVLIIPAEKGDVFVMEQYGITDSAFDFLLAVQRETIYKGGLFDTPPANIPGNVSNRALGYFMACSVVRDTVVISE